MLCLLLALGALVLSLAGATDIKVPDEPVVALFGQDATLRCFFSPEANFSLNNLSLIWQLTDTNSLLQDQYDQEPNKDLKPGDLAAVTCHASRGYPEANVLWQDSQGSNITENVTMSQVANEEGLFDVHSVLQVLVEPSSTYSCLVRNPVLQQEIQASVTITSAMEITVPDEPVVALFGRDATLHCSFSPEVNFSLNDLSLIWQLTDTKRLVHSFSGGQDQLADQGGGYANRTALFYDQLAQGNVSLLLRRVEISDEGSFTCFVRVRDYNSAAVTLQVAAPYSKPSMNLEPNKDLKPGDLAAVTCHASRGYPEANVLWQDSQGSNITENVTTSQVANEEGLFDVHSVLQVLVEPSSTYSCLVRNPVLQQETQASVTITGQHLAFPAVALWVTVGLAICVVGLLAVLAYVCQKKIRQSCEEEEENAGTEEQDEEGEEPKTALQLLKSAESKDDNEQEID